MNAFPDAAELQFLVGRQLSEIVLQPNAVQFRWWEGGQITAMFDIEHVDEDGRNHRYDNAAFTGSPLLLHRLLSKRIVMLHVEAFCLTLGFEGGQQLRFFAATGRGENGLIMFGANLEEDHIVF